LLTTYCECHQVLIEAAHQRKLTQDIHESQEIVDGAVHPQYSSTCLVNKSICDSNLINSRLRPGSS
jgi:hypothetical protein